MEGEKRAAAIKIQLALVKSIGLTDEEMEWLNKFDDPDIIEDIRIAIKDGMKVSAAMDAFMPDMSQEQAREARLSFYRICKSEAENKKNLSAIMNYMDELRRLIEEKADSIIINMDKSYEGLNKQRDGKKKLFVKRPHQDALVQLVEKGRFNPEQLEEITFAINEGLSGEIISAIAKPELSPEAMHQLRLFYIAKNMASAGKSSSREYVREPEAISEVRDEVADDYEEESEDYG